MLKFKLGSLALGACLLAFGSTAAHASNLLVNGSFEDTTNFSPNISSHSQELAVGSTVMTGWTVIGKGGLTWIGPTNPYGETASAGNYALDLTGLTDSPSALDGVTQTIATIAGAHYRLTFDLGSDAQYGLPAGIQASAGNATQTFESSLVNGALQNAWASESLDFTATSANTQVTLQGWKGDRYVGLDNVGVVFLSAPLPTPGAAPEPASWALMILGFGAAGSVLRRRKSTSSTYA